MFQLRHLLGNYVHMSYLGQLLGYSACPTFAGAERVVDEYTIVSLTCKL